MFAASAADSPVLIDERFLVLQTDGTRANPAEDPAIAAVDMDRRRLILASVLTSAVWCGGGIAIATNEDMLILDDFARDDLVSRVGTPWRGFSDQVMGGISQETIALTEIDARRCLRLTGDVRLENNGGFIQMALDLAPDGSTFDASPFAGVLLMARGNGESYGVHLRTSDCKRPWQSYRAGFIATSQWQEIKLLFDRFERYRLEEPLDLGRLRRIGLVAIGRAFRADFAVSALALYH